MDLARQRSQTRALWQPAQALAAAEVSPGLLALLGEPGSLTARLRLACEDNFSVQVLRQERCRSADYPEHQLAAADTGGLLREVYLLCDATAVVFAQTLVPDATLQAHPWLSELGAEPLGEKLFARDDVVRRPFEFAHLEGRHPLARRALASLPAAALGEDGLWARRSQFLLGGLCVSVNEVFFPHEFARHA